jgi:hypothetical protein
MIKGGCNPVGHKAQALQRSTEPLFVLVKIEGRGGPKPRCEHSDHYDSLGRASSSSTSTRHNTNVLIECCRICVWTKSLGSSIRRVMVSYVVRSQPSPMIASKHLGASQRPTTPEVTCLKSVPKGNRIDILKRENSRRVFTSAR